MTSDAGDERTLRTLPLPQRRDLYFASSGSWSVAAAPEFFCGHNKPSRALRVVASQN